MIRFYCGVCDKHQPVDIENLVTDKQNPDLAWGDVICKNCHFIIATISTDIDKQGRYEFVRTKSVIDLKLDFMLSHPEVTHIEDLRNV